MSEFNCEPVARIYNDYTEKFGIPRQSGLVNEVVSRIVFEPGYRNADALRGMEEFSHLWLLWVFSEGFRSDRSWSPTVRPPRLGGNERMGVFATRSPNRPNPIGLSCVELDHIGESDPDGPVIYVRGADLMNGTPILDIKPYITYADSHPEARSGFAAASPEILAVRGLENLPSDADREGVAAVLSQDPRPAYHEDPERIYGLRFGSMDIHFTVCDGVVTIQP